MYTNPVYPESFPDPYVLKVRGEYWAYCTGFWPDGRCFGVLRSHDLVHWTQQAGAMAPLPGAHPCYWAPEVVEHAGLFYLYYSVGNEERMEIRVAGADHPSGPFADSGHRLTSEPFAIDAHVFTDPASGVRYLFYATDFLDSSHIGTGTVVDRLLDPFTLEGRPRPVALPRFDWHVYHPNRPEKGGVRWHTVEGPFVLERKGLYYEMFSGGNWQNPTYGVSYATIAGLSDLAGPGEWVQAADGERVLPILRTSGEVVGPGHNSVVRGPDNRQLWCVYHRWSFDVGAPSARVMAIDPLDWAGERLLVLGPTTSPQPAPIPPTLFFDQPGNSVYDAGAPSFLVEVSARGPAFGLALHGPDGLVWRLLVREGLQISWRGGEERFPLPSSFSPQSFHLLRLDLDGTRVRLTLDGLAIPWTGRLATPAHGISLLPEADSTEFAGFALTVGWEELFLENGDSASLGWQPLHSVYDGMVTKGRLRLLSGPSLLVRGPALPSYLLVVNVRLDEPAERGWTIHPAVSGDGGDGGDGPGPGLTLIRHAQGWALSAQDAAGERLFPLPESFDPFMDQQLRCRREGGRIQVEWEGLRLGEVTAPPGPSRVGIGTAGGAVSFEMVRVTALPEL